MDNFWAKMERIGFSKSGLTTIFVVLVIGGIMYVLTEPKEAAVPKPPTPPAQNMPAQPNTVQPAPTQAR